MLCCQKKAWIDGPTMLHWVNSVYNPYVEGKSGFAHLLVDDYPAHKTESVQKAVKGAGSLYSILPGNYLLICRWQYISHPGAGCGCEQTIQRRLQIEVGTLDGHREQERRQDNNPCDAGTLGC